MDDPSQPPPSKTLAYAAAGGFVGAVAGVLAASALMGDGESDTQAAAAQEPTEQVLVADND